MSMRFTSAALFLLGSLTLVMPAQTPVASATLAVCVLLVARLLLGLAQQPGPTASVTRLRWRGPLDVGVVMPRQWAPAGPGRPQPRAPGGGCRVTITV